MLHESLNMQNVSMKAREGVCVCVCACVGAWAHDAWRSTHVRCCDNTCERAWILESKTSHDGRCRMAQNHLGPKGQINSPYRPRLKSWVSGIGVWWLEPAVSQYSPYILGIGRFAV